MQLFESFYGLFATGLLYLFFFGCVVVMVLMLVWVILSPFKGGQQVLKIIASHLLRILPVVERTVAVLACVLVFLLVVRFFLLAS